MQVPIVDISSFTSADGDASARAQAATDLGTKLQRNGWVGLTGHGIASEQLEQAFDVSRKFFDLSYEDKMKAPHPDGITPHRGFSGIFQEQGAASLGSDGQSSIKEHQATQVKDFKESFEVGTEGHQVEYNIWPPEEIAPGFRDFTTAFHGEMNRLAASVLEALAMSLNLTEDETQDLQRLHANGHENQLRLLHYPPADGKALAADNTSRLGAHRDWPTCTLVFQDKNTGLEFYDNDTNAFVSAVPIDGVVYMNIADMFHRYTNGRYPSALHRVVVPETIGGGVTPSRYSIPFFVTPSPDRPIAPPPSIAASSSGPVFEPVTYGVYSKAQYEAVRT